MECPDCEGEGIIHEICPECEGNPDTVGDAGCSTCEGEGYIETACQRCNQTGEIDV